MNKKEFKKKIKSKYKNVKFIDINMFDDMYYTDIDKTLQNLKENYFLVMNDSNDSQYTYLPRVHCHIIYKIVNGDIKILIDRRKGK